MAKPTESEGNGAVKSTSNTPNKQKLFCSIKRALIDLFLKWPTFQKLNGLRIVLGTSKYHNIWKGLQSE